MLDKIGRLAITGSFRKNGRLYSNVLCDCGIKKDMRSDYIRKCIVSGLEVSCGCRQKEVVRNLGNSNRVYNYNRAKMVGTYNKMIARCTDPSCHSYKYYGGRGIEVCLAWRISLEQFIKDVGIPTNNSLQIDRIDNNGNYSPENVHWVSATVNSRNRSITKMITAFGKTKPLATWCEELNINYDVVKQRLNKLKWEPERALTEASFLGKNQTYIEVNN